MKLLDEVEERDGRIDVMSRGQRANRTGFCWFEFGSVRLRLL